MFHGGYMRGAIALLLIAAATLPLPGCVVHAYPHTVAVVKVGHVHSDLCGHYYYHGGWYIMANHRHYAGCGHVYRYNMWIHDDGGSVHGETVVVVQGHVHNDHCGHFFYNGGWYMSNGHHHGPGCGHVNQGGRWVFVEVENRHEVKKADHQAEVQERKTDKKADIEAHKESNEAKRT